MSIPQILGEFLEVLKTIKLIYTYPKFRTSIISITINKGIFDITNFHLA